MRTRFILVLATLTLFAASLFAGEPARRTIFIKDGKVIKDGDVVDLTGEMLRFPRAWLGVSLIDLTPELREHFGGGRQGGVMVSDVADDSPAAKAGVQVGDIIVSIDGKEIESAAGLRRGLADKKKGDSARLDVLRGRTRQSLVATVAERELPVMQTMHLEDLSRTLREKFDSPEWRARVERMGDCGDLQTRIRELESRLKDLEKKLQK